MAEAWSMAPWLVEEKASALWADRFMLLESAKAERDHPKQLVGQSQGTVSRRLV